MVETSTGKWPCLLLALIVAVGACGDESKQKNPDGAVDAVVITDGAAPDGTTAPDGPVTDAAVPDGPVADAAVPDGSVPDGTGTDGPLPDGPAADGPVPDSALPDGPVPDGPDPDAALPDSALPDSAPPDSTASDALAPDSDTPDALVPDAQPGCAAVTSCIPSDGCCPAKCNNNNDSDCPVVCGNGAVEAGETCDPIPLCPTVCDDSDACTTDTLLGDPAQCTAKCDYAPVGCVGGDGCCPPGCDKSTDSDCTAICDNGILEPGEYCDPVSSCPTDCDDKDPCTNDTLLGDAMSCTARCDHSSVGCADSDGCCLAACNANTDNDCPSVCDNGVLEPGEYCDPVSSCPTDCDDKDPCTNDTLLGDAMSCTARCDHSSAGCADNDGCCLATCNANTDNDCPSVCDNGILEPGEYCDPVSSCPTYCDDKDPCTNDTLLGDAMSCTARCDFTSVGCVDNDGCCPSGCDSGSDNDC